MQEYLKCMKYFIPVSNYKTIIIKVVEYNNFNILHYILLCSKECKLYNNRNNVDQETVIVCFTFCDNCDVTYFLNSKFSVLHDIAAIFYLIFLSSLQSFHFLRRHTIWWKQVTDKI